MLGRDPLHLPAAAALVAVAGIAWWSADFFGHEVLAEIAIFVIFAMSLDLLVGYAGLVSLGHAAFLAVGAYATAAFTVFLGWPVSAATVAAVGCAAALAAVAAGALIVAPPAGSRRAADRGTRPPRSWRP